MKRLKNQIYLLKRGTSTWRYEMRLYIFISSLNTEHCTPNTVCGGLWFSLPSSHVRLLIIFICKCWKRDKYDELSIRYFSHNEKWILHRFDVERRRTLLLEIIINRDFSFIFNNFIVLMNR